MSPPVQSPNPTLLLIDGPAIAYKAHFALPKTITAPSGRPAGATYGFFSMLLRLWKDRQPAGLVVVWDAGGSFRHDLYPAYKEGRPEVPEQVRVEQSAHICEVLRSLAVPVLAIRGFEGDDLASSVARQNRDYSDVEIVSVDRDLLQCLTHSGVSLALSRKGMSDLEWYDAARLQDEYGIAAERYWQYVALVGDNADNIPGLPTFGPKRSKTVLTEAQSYEDVLGHPLVKRVSLTPGELESHFSLVRSLVCLRDDIEVPPIPRWAPGGARVDWGRLDVVGLQHLRKRFETLLGDDTNPSLPFGM